MKLILTAGEVTEMTGLDKKTLDKLVRDGHLRRFRFPGSRWWRYKQSDLINLIDRLLT